MYIDHVQLINIRCFANLSLKFRSGKGSPHFTAILGDNATGKTTLLKSIAMGLCDESSAAGLMKEADAGYVRRGESKGMIRIMLSRPEGRRKYVIETTIERTPVGERLRQKTDPGTRFPWDELFVSAYGAGRSTSGTGDLAEYTVLNAVYNLFNYAEGLQNPELSLLRIRSESARKMVLETLNRFLSTDAIDFTRKGVVLDGHWGKDMPLRDLADGYKSGFLWLTDFLGWAVLRSDSLQRSEDIVGIVLVDELEQHLHPKWQECVVSDLRNLFPNVQFIVGSHSPLIVSQIGDIGDADADADSHQIIHLKLHDENKVIATPYPSVRGWRTDQILASEAFNQVIPSDSELDESLAELSRLSGLGDKQSSKDKARYAELKQLLSQHLVSDLGTTEADRDVQRKLDRAMQGLADRLLSKLEEDSQ